MQDRAKALSFLLKNQIGSGSSRSFRLFQKSPGQVVSRVVQWYAIKNINDVQQTSPLNAPRIEDLAPCRSLYCVSCSILAFTTVNGAVPVKLTVGVKTHPFLAAADFVC